MNRNERDICPHCGNIFVSERAQKDKGVRREHCGQPFCRAMAGWTDEQWEGRARMARAAQLAGYTITVTVNEDGEPVAHRSPYVMGPWDAEALRRFPNPTFLQRTEVPPNG